MVRALKDYGKESERITVLTARDEALFAPVISAWAKYCACMRKSVEALWEAGKAFDSLKNELFAHGGFKQWCEGRNIPLASANQAIRLYVWDKTGEQIKALKGITEAKIAAGIVAPAKHITSEPAEADGKSTDHTDEPIDCDLPSKQVGRCCDSLYKTTNKIESLIVDLDADEAKTIATMIDLAIGHLTTIRKKILKKK